MWGGSTNYLPTQVLGEIASHELMEDEEAVDEIYWNGSTNGEFTLGSALSIIRNEESDSESQAFIWSDVWKVQVPQRIRLFLWLATQDRLMTNGNRFIRKITLISCFGEISGSRGMERNIF